MKNEIKNLINKQYEKTGLRMAKLKSPSEHGLFHYKAAVYEYRVARSIEEEQELSKDGFGVDEDLGVFLYNALTKAKY